MQRSIYALFALSLIQMGATGCTRPGDLRRDAGDGTRSMVRIDLSYTHLASAPVNDIRFDAQAHFVRYRAFDPAGVPTILGFTDFDGLVLDTCKVSDGTAELDEALASSPGDVSLPAEVALLDAGRIDVRGPADRAMLRPAHYPELVPFVSGVVYGGDDTHPIALGLGQAYQVSGEGGEEVGPFTAQVTAPRAFPQLALEPLRRSEPLDLRWVGEPEAQEALLLEVKWTSRAGARSVRCRVRDDGEFSIPAIDTLPAAATLTATRLSRGTLTAPGAGKGEFTVELRNVASLQVAP